MSDLSLMIDYLMRHRTVATFAEAVSVSQARIQDYVYRRDERVLKDPAIRRIMRLFEVEVMNEKLDELRADKERIAAKVAKE